MTDIDNAAEAAEPRPAVPFAAWLQDLRGGRAHAELTDALRSLIDAVTTHQKEGELAFKLKVKPTGSGGTQVIVVDETVVKAPTAARPVSLFFVDPAHNLTRDDPYRQQLPLREVPPADVATLKDAQ